MVDQEVPSQINEEVPPRPRRSILIRAIRLINRKRRSQIKLDGEHAKNERTMAHWTRRVGVFTIILAICACANVLIIYFQLREMHSGGIDTHNLALAAHDQAQATDKLKGSGEAQAKAMDRLRLAGEAQAAATEKMRLAGENQAIAAKLQAGAMAGLRGAGEAQARSTAALAENSGKQISALMETANAARVQAESARAQAAAISKSAEAAILQSKATDRLANSGQAQSIAVLQSLDVAKQANEIATQANTAEHRPWVEMSMPGGTGPVPAPVAGADFSVTITMTNKGRSPALLVSTNIALEIVKVTPTVHLDDLSPCANQCQQTTLFPEMNALSGGGLEFHPAIPAAQITADEVAKIAAFEDTIVLRTRADYIEPGGTLHHTLGCSYWNPKILHTGGFTACLIGNQAN